MCRTGVTRPVSVSTSTIETCAPNGKVAPFWVKSVSEPSPHVVLVRPGGELAPADAGAGDAADREPAVGQLDVGGVGLQHPGGDAAGLVQHLVGGLADRVAAELQRARPAGAAAGADQCGVGLDVA